MFTFSSQHIFQATGRQIIHYLTNDDMNEICNCYLSQRLLLRFGEECQHEAPFDLLRFLILAFLTEPVVCFDLVLFNLLCVLILFYLTSCVF